jgi:hypothetical protein
MPFGYIGKDSVHLTTGTPYRIYLANPVIAILLGAIPSAMAETNSQHYNVGYNDGWYQAQTD